MSLPLRLLLAPVRLVATLVFVPIMIILLFAQEEARAIRILDWITGWE